MQSTESVDGVYTISFNNKQGRDNLGHTISELSEAPSSISIVSHQHPEEKLSNAQVSHKSTNISEIPETMTPTILSSTIKMGKRTAMSLDLIIIILLGLWLGLIELGIFPHVKRGFFCDDRSIAFKFTGDTISAAVIITSVFVPLFLLWIVEAIFYKPNSLKASRVKSSFYRALFYFREYAIGMVVKLFIVDALKVLVGELRPHFIDTCRPDAIVNCTNGRYISEYQCTNTVDSHYFVRDSQKSFPSGHSSISVFEAVFMIWYLQNRLPKLRSVMLLPFLQCLCLFWACLCSVSRISDHRHHWWDVLAGTIFGIIFAALTCIFLCKNFKRNDNPSEVIHQNGNGDLHHTSVRRLLSDVSCKDEVTLNHVTVP